MTLADRLAVARRPRGASVATLALVLAACLDPRAGARTTRADGPAPASFPAGSAAATAGSGEPARSPPESTPPPRVDPPAPSASGASPALERTPRPLVFEGGAGAYYPPDVPGDGRPVTVYLHGMCASGALECPVFAAAARTGYLVCPDGTGGCGGGGFLWAASQKSHESRLAAVRTALEASEGARVGKGPQALIGYSLGAPAALLQVVREPGRYHRLMLVNASVAPTAAQMKKAGIERVALVAGARDATAPKLASVAARLAAGGISARYFALEATGHYFDAQSAERMAAPIAWLLGP